MSRLLFKNEIDKGRQQRATEFEEKFTLFRSYGLKGLTQQRDISEGKGRMVAGKYQQYTDADRQHLAGASANSQADYQDIYQNSQLGRFKKRQTSSQKATLLGGFTSLGG